MKPYDFVTMKILSLHRFDKMEKEFRPIVKKFFPDEFNWFKKSINVDVYTERVVDRNLSPIMNSLKEPMVVVDPQLHERLRGISTKQLNAAWKKL